MKETWSAKIENQLLKSLLCCMLKREELNNERSQIQVWIVFL